MQRSSGMAPAGATGHPPQPLRVGFGYSHRVQIGSESHIKYNEDISSCPKPLGCMSGDRIERQARFSAGEKHEQL